MPATSKTVEKTVKKIKTKQKSIKNSLIGKVRKKIKSISDSIFWYLLSWRFVVFLWVLFVAVILSYIFLFFSASRIETLITFPGRDINLKEITNHPAWLLVAENVSYTAPSGNTITGLYIDNNSEKVVYYFPNRIFLFRYTVYFWFMILSYCAWIPMIWKCYWYAILAGK